MNEDRRKILIQKHEIASVGLIGKIKKYKKIYIYMPTWRNDGKDFVSEANINWSQLSESLSKNQALLILKMHFHTRIDYNLIEKHNNILMYPGNVDVYTILPYTDCLITDYSSIYCDYVLMNKEIILFTFDYDSYIKGSYELLDYDTYYRGQRANSFTELNYIIRENKDCHLSSKDQKFVIESFWNRAFDDRNIVEEIKERTK